MYLLHFLFCNRPCENENFKNDSVPVETSPGVGKKKKKKKALNVIIPTFV